MRHPGANKQTVYINIKHMEIQILVTNKERDLRVMVDNLDPNPMLPCFLSAL